MFVLLCHLPLRYESCVEAKYFHKLMYYYSSSHSNLHAYKISQVLIWADDSLTSLDLYVLLLDLDAVPLGGGTLRLPLCLHLRAL